MDHDAFFDWVVKILVAGAFGTWAWVVKHFGERHLISMNELNAQLRNMSSEISEIKIRLGILEHDYRAHNNMQNRE